MKNFMIKIVVIILMSISAAGLSFAKNSICKITIENVKYVSSNVLEFDIYLLSTGTENAGFEYILGQYFIEFNPGIANGGILTYSLIGSDLPHQLQPKNPTVTGNQLRLASNKIPSKNDLPVISEKLPGTLIARMRLATSERTFSDELINLKLRTGPADPFSKVFAYVDNQIVEVTNQEEVVADNVLGAEKNTSLPKEFALMQNYPNPFNPTTNISFDIPELANVKLSVYDVTGREVAVLVNEQLNRGSYNYEFKGSNFSSGIYFYRIRAGNFIQVKKMVLIK